MLDRCSCSCFNVIEDPSAASLVSVLSSDVEGRLGLGEVTLVLSLVPFVDDDVDSR